MKTDTRLGGWWTPGLLWPVVAAAAVRLALLAFAIARSGPAAVIGDDTLSYLIPGRNLLLHGAFVDSAGRPELFRAPGYPPFLAFFSLPGLPVAALAQILLSVLSVVLVWRIAHLIFRDDRTALVAAWIFAFDLLSTVNSVLLLSETLFLTILLLAVERLVAFLSDRHLPTLAAAGLWLAAATYVRPVTYYLPFALALGLFFVLARVPGLRWKAPAVLLATVLPCFAIWQARNWKETGYRGFTSIQVINPYYFQAVDVVSRVEHRSFGEVQGEFGRRAEPPGSTLAQQMVFEQRETGRILHAHPATLLRSQVQGSVRLAVSPGAADLFQLLKVPTPGDRVALVRMRSDGLLRTAFWFIGAYPGQAAAMAFLSAELLVLYLLAGWGFARGPAPAPHLWLMLGLVLYFFAVSGGAAEMARYRLPVMPIVCIFAAAGLRVTSESNSHSEQT